MPTKQFNTFGMKWTLNPGPFNIKEHALITIMSNVTFGQGPAYSTDTLEALLGFYKINLGWGFNLLYTISTQVYTVLCLLYPEFPHSDDRLT